MSGILVDTCVWSIALRGSSKAEASVVKQLTRLIDDNQVKIIGAIRQELLSGYTDKSQYERLRQKLKYFPNEPLLDSDYEAARVLEFLSLKRNPRLTHRFPNLCCCNPSRIRNLHYR